MRRTLMLAVLVLAAGLTTQAAEKTAPHALAVPAGTRVEVDGGTIAMRGVNGQAGWFRCGCHSKSGGACVVAQSPGVLDCVSSSTKACESCTIETANGGLTAGGATALSGGAPMHAATSARQMGPR